MQRLEPDFDRDDGEVTGMVEKLLRLAVVQQERVVDHHEVHIGVAPISDRIAAEEERYRKAEDDRGQSPSPAEKGQRREGIKTAARGRCVRGKIHAGRLLSMAVRNGNRFLDRGSATLFNAAKR